MFNKYSNVNYSNTDIANVNRPVDIENSQSFRIKSFFNDNMADVDNNRRVVITVKPPVIINKPFVDDNKWLVIINNSFVIVNKSFVDDNN